MYERLKKAYADVRKKIDFVPEVALTLGSGLGDFADCIKQVATLAYSEISGFPVSTVQGHKGQFVFGYIGEIPVVVMQGRVHYYEGYSMEDVVLPVRLMHMMGAKTLILTNAAGGVDLSFCEGALMAITDHIMFAPNPLLGENISELGTRFPDMSQIYDRELLSLLRSCAKENGIPLKEGVYMQVTGPSFETPAEIKAYRQLGASAVGMSTACEAVTARHMGMRVMGVSCITNMAAGVTEKPLTHEEVKITADRVKDGFQKLIYQTVLKIGR